MVASGEVGQSGRDLLVQAAQDRGFLQVVIAQLSIIQSSLAVLAPLRSLAFVHIRNPLPPLTPTLD